MAAGKPRGKVREKRIRQQGTGSVFWNAAKGRYQATIDLGQSADGKRIRKTYTARAKGETREAREECETWLAQAQGEALAGTIKPPSRETVRRYLEEWVQTKTALTWSERWAQEVADKLRLYVYPVIGTIRLNDLEAAHLRRVYAAMSRTVSGRTKRPLSKQSVLHVHRILHSAFGRRIRWEDVEAPSVKRRASALPEPEAISGVLARAMGARHGLVFVLMALTGARPQEVLALRRSDLDFTHNTISINEAMVTRGPVRFKETKTEESRRTLEVPAEVMDRLRAYGEERAALQLQAGRVFTTDAGAPLPIWRLYTVWRGLLKAADVPYFRPYDLRHFAASYWLDEGIPLATVSAALGHSTQRTTASVYSHKLRRSESRIAATGGKLLRLNTLEAAVNGG